jgi:type I restriction enzyme S subunit
MNRWPTKPLGELLELSRERIQPTEHPDTYFNYVGLENIEGHTGRLIPYQPTLGADIKSTKNVFHLGEILYGKLRPNLNKVHLARKSGICSTDIYVLRPQQRHIHPSFAANYLRSPSVLRMVTMAMAGANLPRIDQDALLASPAPVPPVVEQERIVKLLDEADELRKLRAQADRRTADLIPALFHEMFGDPTMNTRNWRRQTLSDLLDGIDGGWSPTCQDRPAQGAEWGVLKLGAVTTCEYIHTENKALLEGFTPRPELEVKVGDLLFTRKNTYELVAACAFVFETRRTLMLSDLIFRFRLKPDVHLNPVFLWGLLTTPGKRKQVQTLASGSAGSMPNISKGRLLALPIEVPPLPLQEEFAKRVTEIRELKARQAASRARLDALFQSMLHRAFHGEL